MRDVGPYTRVGRVAGGDNCVGEHDLASALVRQGCKRRPYGLSARVLPSLEVSYSYIRNSIDDK